MTNKCRRCVECANMTHHWMPNEDWAGPDDPEYVCKHCDAEGMECSYCSGEGCGQCEGEGIALWSEQDHGANAEQEEGETP